MSQLSLQQQDELKKRIVTNIKMYTEPGMENNNKSEEIKKPKENNGDDND